MADGRDDEQTYGPATASVALGLGILLFGASAALAAPKGVGPSAGTTGTARACQVHAANKRKSLAKGLNCTPTPPPPTAATFDVVVSPSTQSDYCDVTLSGTGLAPGAPITVESNGVLRPVDVVSADGTYNVVIQGAVSNDGTVYTFTAPTAAGGTIVIIRASVC